MTRATRRHPPPAPASLHDTLFRTAERRWKSRAAPPPLSLAFDPDTILWSAPEAVYGQQRGVWRNEETGKEVECWKVELGELGSSGMGQSRWKGKEREHDEVRDYAVVIPSFPGLVLLPSLLPPPLQRHLVIESLRHSVLPNLNLHSKHYVLPHEGLWGAWEAGKGDEVLVRIGGAERAGRRVQVDFDPITEGNWKEAMGRGEKEVREGEEKAEGETREATVEELLSKLRWTTIGMSYDWTSKAYDFDTPPTPLPPLIRQTCRDAVRAVPWPAVFGHPPNGSGEWSNWSRDYEPHAGIINFYQPRDSLTAHIDQSEVDSVQPLVSFSIGASGVFLVGGPTRDTEPLAILLRSGDGLLMSGKEGRRVFHGLPRVVADSLPPYLSSTEVSGVDGVDWRLFGEYLERGTRMNINVRAVW